MKLIQILNITFVFITILYYKTQYRNIMDYIKFIFILLNDQYIKYNMIEIN